MTGNAETLPAARRRKRKNLRTPTPDQPERHVAPPAAVDTEPPMRAGWAVIAVKEFADQVSSVRFLILGIVLTLAAAAAVYNTAGGLKGVAADASGSASLFLLLFTRSVEGSGIPPFTSFITFLGPLLGIAFGFDGINAERSDATLPRLLAQPIHRDDVINGKFVAGLASIGVLLVAIIGIVAAIGIMQLGILPSAEEVLRLLVWVVLAIAYVGFWLAFALLCSVVLRRAATSALMALGVWLLVTVFASLLVGVLAGLISPIPPGASPTSPEAVANAATEVNLSRLTPNELFQESTAVILDPRLRTVTPDLVTPGQADLAIASLLSLDQSLLVIWPQFASLIAATIVTFGAGYVAFMRQEVRA